MNIIKDFKELIGEKNTTIVYKLFNFPFHDKKDDFYNFVSILPKNIKQNVELFDSESIFLSEDKINIQITKDFLIDFYGNLVTHFNLKTVLNIDNTTSLTIFSESLKKDFLINSFHYKNNENTLMVEKFKDNDYSILIVDQRNQMINRKLGRKILSEFFSFVLNNNLKESIEMVNLKNDCDISKDIILIEMIKSLKNDLSIINNRKKLKTKIQM